MTEKILSDVLQAVALFFLNPLFAASLLAAVLLGYFRVKRERRSFKVRLLPGLTELKRLVSESWLYGLVLSLVISGVGLIVDSGWLVLFCVAAFASLVTFYYKIASPIYFAAAAFFALYFMGKYAGEFTYLGWTAGSVDLFGRFSCNDSHYCGASTCCRRASYKSLFDPGCIAISYADKTWIASGRFQRETTLVTSSAFSCSWGYDNRIRSVLATVYVR